MLAPPISSAATPTSPWQFTLGSGNGASLAEENPHHTDKGPQQNAPFVARVSTGRRKSDSKTPASPDLQHQRDAHYHQPDALPDHMLLQTSILASLMPLIPAVSKQPPPITTSFNIRDKHA